MFKYLPIILFLYFFSAFNVLANQTSLQMLIEGTEYCKNKQYEKGIELNSNALLFAETEEGPNSWNVAKILKGLGQCYLEKGDRSLALPLYMRALEIAENIWGNDHENVRTILYQMGRLYLLSENSAEADKYLTRSYNIFKKNPSKDLLVEGYFLYYLGEVRTIECRYSQAEEFLKQSLLCFENSKKAGYQELSNPLIRLGELYLAQNKLELALSSLQKALIILENALGEDNIEVARTIDKIINIREEMHQYKEIEPLARRSYLIKQSVLGIDHQESIGSEIELATCCYFLNKSSEAITLFKSVIEKMDRISQSNSPAMASCNFLLGRIYHDKGRIENAEKMYLRSIQIQENLKPDKNSELRLKDKNLEITNLYLGKIYEARGDFNMAVPCYQKAISLKEKRLGPNHSEFISSLKDLVLYYKSHGKDADAKSLLNKYRAAATIK